MLRTPPRNTARPDLLMLSLLDAMGQGGEDTEIEPGMIRTQSWSPQFSYSGLGDSFWMRGPKWIYEIDWDSDDDAFEDYFGNFGVCDSPEQFKRTPLYKRMVEHEQEMCVFFVHVPKVPGEEGGWRWHKWGAYIGEGEPQCEYLADEPAFDDGVYTYHVYPLL